MDLQELPDVKQNVTFKLPNEHTKGFFKRTKMVSGLFIRMRDGDEQALPELIQVVKPYVTSFTGYDTVEEALEDLTQAEWREVVTALLGKNLMTP